MMRLADHLATADLREIHLAIFQDEGAEHLRSGPFGHEEPRRTEQRIRNVSGSRLRRVMDALPEFGADMVPWAWAYFMALAAGTHVWPDANHRTAMVAFDRAVREGLGLTIALPEKEAAQMVEASRPYMTPNIVHTADITPSRSWPIQAILIDGFSLDSKTP